MRATLPILGLCVVAVLSHPATIRSQTEDPEGRVFLGTSPPNADSSGALALAANLLRDRGFRWTSSDRVLGEIDTGFVAPTTWVVTGAAPDRLVFTGRGAGVTVSGNVLFTPYNRAVVDVVRGSARVRYLLTDEEIDMIMVNVANEEIDFAAQTSEAVQAPFSATPGEAGGNGGFGGPPGDTTMDVLSDPFKLTAVVFNAVSTPRTITATIASNVSSFTQTFVLTEDADSVFADPTGSQVMTVVRESTADPALFDTVDLYVVSSTFGWFGATTLTETGTSSNVFESEHATATIAMDFAPSDLVPDTMTVTLASDLAAKAGAGTVTELLIESGRDTNHFTGPTVTLDATFFTPADSDGRLAITAIVDAPDLGFEHKSIDAVQVPGVPVVLLTTESLHNQGGPAFERVGDFIGLSWRPVIPDAKGALRDVEDAGLFYKRGSGPERPVAGLDSGVIQMVKGLGGSSLAPDAYGMTTKADGKKPFFFFGMTDRAITVPSWRKARPWPTGICESNRSIVLAGLQAGDRLIVRLARDPSVKAELVLVEVEITAPKGNAGEKVVTPGSFLDTAPPYRYDWQGIVSGARGTYALRITGAIRPAAFGYQWTLEAPCGTLASADTAAPTHTAPASTGTGAPDFVECRLMLVATHDGMPTKARTRKYVRVYKDHLARDIANFQPMGTVDVRSFAMPGGSRAIGFNCHESTAHHNRGEALCDPAAPFWGTTGFKKEVQVTHASTGGGTHPALGTLNRGDIVAYYDHGNVLMHSQTATGNGTETFGANNVPMSFPGAPANQSWRWAPSTAGDWANNLWLPGAGIMPVTIRVFDKP